MRAIRVLIVEHDSRRRASLISCFAPGGRPRKGFSVAGAGVNLTNALAQVVEPGPVDVLVVDVDRPGLRRLQGWATLRMLLTGTRVVGLTDGNRRSIQAAMAAGVTCLHPHTIDCPTLTRVTRRAHMGLVDYAPELLERARELFLDPVDEEEIRVGGVTIDLKRREVICWGRRIRLTSLEFNLLSYLAQRPGEPITSTELLQGVWGLTRHTGGTEAQVKNCIQGLRQKLEPNPAFPRYIIARRGLGYLLHDPLED